MAEYLALLQSRCKLVDLGRMSIGDIKLDENIGILAPAPDLKVTAVEPGEPAWIVSVDGRDVEQRHARCPVCGTQSSSRQGAPQARQIADRFHLLRNRRETIERQLGRFEAPIQESPLLVEDDPDTPEPIVIEPSDGCSEVATQDRLLRSGRYAARQGMFDQIRGLYDAGHAVTEIVRKLGLGPRRVYRWVRRIDLPEPSAMAPKPCTPAYFGAFLARSWAEGTAKVRHPFAEIRHRGYTGSYSHLARFLAPWRNNSPSENASEPSSLDQEAHAPPQVRTMDPIVSSRRSPRRHSA
jgi:hypothetical protein